MSLDIPSRWFVDDMEDHHRDNHIHSFLAYWFENDGLRKYFIGFYLCLESIFRTSSFFFIFAKRSFGVNIWSSLSKSTNRSGISTLSGLKIYSKKTTFSLSCLPSIITTHFFINRINIKIFLCFSCSTCMWIRFEDTLQISLIIQRRTFKWTRYTYIGEHTVISSCRFNGSNTCCTRRIIVTIIGI